MTAAAHRKWLLKVARELDRERLTKARAAVLLAREAKRTAGKRAKAACKRARAAFRVWRARERKALAERIRAMRARLKQQTSQRQARVQACCGRDERARVRARSDAAIATAREALAALLVERKRERAWKGSTAPKAASLVRARERAKESDHEVEVNLSPDELIIWQRVRGEIRGTDRMSRTEAFQHWLHENGAEAARILAADAEVAYQRAVKAEAAERKRMKKPRTAAELAEYVTDELAGPAPSKRKRYADAVPF